MLEHLCATVNHGRDGGEFEGDAGHETGDAEEGEGNEPLGYGLQCGQVAQQIAADCGRVADCFGIVAPVASGCRAEGGDANQDGDHDDAEAKEGEEGKDFEAEGLAV